MYIHKCNCGFTYWKTAGIARLCYQQWLNIESAVYEGMTLQEICDYTDSITEF